MNNSHPRIVELPSSSPSNSFIQDVANNNTINNSGSNTASPIITTPDSQDTLAFLNAPSSSNHHHHHHDSTDLMSPETRSALAMINASHTANSIAAGSRSNMSPLTGLASSSGQISNGGGAASSSTSSAAVAALPLPSPSSSNAKGSPSSALQPRSSNNSGRGNVAAFLTKLYNMVGDKASNNLIKWSDDGQSFIVVKHVEFAKEVLPKFFKHNNFSSFVRQLNMYGFHKVPHLQQGVLMPDADSEQWEFSNPHFQKNQPDLLYLVSRKKASNGAEDKDALTMDLGHILSEVTAIKRHQVAISSDLKNIERDHQSLWQESLAARERHHRQQETIDKILRFLASVFSGEKKRAIVPNKKPRLTITEGEGQGSSNGMMLEEEDDEGHDDHEEQQHRSNANFHHLHEDHEDEMSRLFGAAGANNGKRNHTTMTGSSTDFVLPGAKSSLSDITPATLSLLSGINSNTGASANTSKKTAPTKAVKGKATTSNIASKAGKLPLTTNPTITNENNTTTAGGLSTISATTASSLPPTSTDLPLDYLNSFPSLSNYMNQPSLKLDPSAFANLSIPTTLLPPNSITPAYYDMLRTISMANAQDTTANPVAPLPPPLFIQTPAGASVTKGVDQITMKMEHLQKSIEALQNHGLNVNDLNFDDDAYMAHYGTDDFTNQDFDYLALNDPSTNPNMPSSSTTLPTSTTSVGANPRISTVGEEEYLEGLLNLDQHS